MKHSLIKILESQTETNLVDFKAIEYELGKSPKKNDFLKDISSFANHLSNEPKYIFTGIQEKTSVGIEVKGIESLTDQAKYQQFINSNVEPSINFEYFPLEYKGKIIGVFKISDNIDRPYLFKKNVKKSDEDKIEFKIGDGFIRTGTSSRKISRNDLDTIYINKMTGNDRKIDIKLEPLIRKFYHKNLDINEPYYVIDFNIENNSNRSIEINFEFKLFFIEGVTVMKKFDLEKQLIEPAKKDLYNYSSPEIVVDSAILDINIESDHESFVVSRIPRVANDFAINIPQKYKKQDILFENVLVHFRKHKCGDCITKIKVIIRSDDFVNGPLIKEYDIAPFKEIE